jgi:hypothetical protein
VLRQKTIKKPASDSLKAPMKGYKNQTTNKIIPYLKKCQKQTPKVVSLNVQKQKTFHKLIIP